MTPGDSNTLYTTWAEVRKSINGGQTWAWPSDGIAALQPWRVAVSPYDPQRVLAVADADGAFGSGNRGNEWVAYAEQLGGSDQYRAAAFDPLSPTVAHLGGTAQIFKTTDNGQTWNGAGFLPLAGYDGAVDWFKRQGWLSDNEGMTQVIERKMYCTGCLGNRETHWSGDCWILKCCVDQRGHSNCSECEAFACERLVDWAKQDDSCGAALARLRQLRGASTQ